MSHEPFSSALLRSDWAVLAREAADMGRHYWDRSTLWGSATMLVMSGHGDVLVRLYDESKPLIRSGDVDIDLVAIPGTILALRNAGRGPEANQLLAKFANTNGKLPDKGLGGTLKRINLAQIATLSGRNDEAVQRLDQLSREAPLILLTVPTMSLLNNPYYRALRNDPRLLAADERLRSALNSERRRAGLAPISRENWVSDQKTLLTKN